MKKNLPIIIALILVVAIGFFFYFHYNSSNLSAEPRSESVPTIYEAHVGVYFGIIEDGEEVIGVRERFLPITHEDCIKSIAMEALIGGPTEGERRDGYFTAISDTTSISSITIESGVGIIDFSSWYAKEDANNDIAREQVNKGLLQFEDIDEVIILVGGEEDSF